MKRLIAFFLLLSIAFSAFAPALSIKSEAAEAPTEIAFDKWYVPTLADTTIRAGRSTIRKTADNWASYLTVSESTSGLTFDFRKAMGTIFEGLSRRVNLDGLCLKFGGFDCYSGGTFALSFGNGEYDRFGFGLIFNAASGTIFAGQANGSALKEVGEALIDNAALTAEALRGQTWTLSTIREVDGSYTLSITIDGKTLQATIAQELIENGSFDPESCCLSLMAVKNLPTFCLTLQGLQQLARPQIPTVESTILRGTGDYASTVNSWAKYLTVTESETLGLRFDFTSAAHSVTEGFSDPVSLHALRVHLSDLQTSDAAKLGRFCLSFGTGGLVRSCFGLIFEFGSGKVYAANAEVSNGVVSAGRVVTVGNALFSDFTYENVAGKDWYVDFSRMTNGDYEIVIHLDGTDRRATLSASVVENYEGFRPEHCYAYLMSAKANTTLSIGLSAFTRRNVPEHIDNSSLLPPHVPSTEVSVDENGTPTWLDSAVIMEVNIPRATREGTLDAAVSVLDHAQEMGVNCIWLTSVGEPGIKNDGSAGNHYVNLGLQSIDPAITGTQDYSQGWQEFAEFVKQAHARNIYVLFNAITWGTTAASPIYIEHPDWYTGAEIWGGKAWDWSNEELIQWYTQTLLDIVETTDIDGILYDCEPSYANEAVCARFRKAIQDSGRNLVYIGESANDRSGAYDLEQYGVMNYNGYSKTSTAIGEHQKDDKEFFIDEGFNIVDAVKNGTISGTIEDQKNGTGGMHKYYTYCFTNHDSYYYSFNNNLLDVAYQGIFSPYIPLWYIGDEFNSTPSGIRLYFDDIKWSRLSSLENREFFEQIKQMLRIRRKYDFIFENFASEHRNSNICKVSTEGALNLQAYARYADNTGILIVGNHNADSLTVTANVHIPFEEMNLSRFDRFTVTDLLSGEVLCRGTKHQVEQFSVTLGHDTLGVYAVVGAGTANEGLTVATAEHALLRNGTAHQANTANAWSKYVTVEDAPLENGLRFRFTSAVTTTGEGINVPISLEDLYLQIDNLSGYVNNGTASNSSKLALSFGPGGYERNSFGIVFDFANGAIYAAKPSSGVSDRLTADTAPMITDDRLKASSLEGKRWAIQFTRSSGDGYCISVMIDSAVLSATLDSSYIVQTDTFDPQNCYLYFTAAGATPTLSFDFVGWRNAPEAMTYFASNDVNKSHSKLSLSEDTLAHGLNVDFRSVSALTGVQLQQTMNLDGVTFYFDDLTNYRNSGTANGSTKFMVGFSSEGAQDTAFGFGFDLHNGKVSLCLNGYSSRQLLSDTGLTYEHFRDVQWSMSLARNQSGTLMLTIALPDGTFSANITNEELAAARDFSSERCRLNVMAWDGPLEMSLRLVSYRKHSFDIDGDGVLEILAIGNSYTTDALWYAWQSAQDLGVEKVALGNLYIANCDIKKHADNAANDAPAYLYYFNDSGTWNTTSNYKISTALTDRSWDYVVLQEIHTVSGIESSYNENLSYLIDYVRANLNAPAKLAWHMTWAYQQDCTHSAFQNYNSDQMTMYNAILSVTQNKICANDTFDIIIPSGTAVQNARTSLLGDTLTRDGYHMSTHVGRYLTALMFLKSIARLTIDHINYTPGDITAEEQLIVKEAVKNAYKVPFAVTASHLTGQAPTSGYTQLDLGITKCAYWNPTAKTSYHRPITNSSNSKNYCATARFTREDLPVGSVIILADGWKYRPDGWYTDHPQSERRSGAISTPYTIVTPQWWGEDTLRSFNISKLDGSSLEALGVDEIRDAFRIYVPTQPCVHSYHSETEAPTCTENGLNTFICPDCADSYNKEVPPHGHIEVVDKAVAPTCSATGLTEGKHCSVCNEVLIAQETVSANGHSYVCTDNGENHVVTCENCNYTATEVHKFVDGSCICGAIESTEPKLDKDLKFNMNIVAGAEMVVNYNFMATVVSKYEDFYLEVKKNVAGGDPIVTTFGVSEGHTAMGSMNHPVTGAALMYNAAYTGINAKEMGDNFATTLYAIDASGKVYRGETVVSSIKDFLLGKLEAESSIREMKTMAVDMLKYGAAAQINFNYDAENLVTNALTEEQLALCTQASPEALDYASASGSGVNVNTSITVKSKVELTLSCIAAGQTEVKCIITDADGKILAELATANIGGVMYSAKYDNVGAKQMREVITATFVNGSGNAISKTVKWSVESYVAQTRANAKSTETEIAMVNAMLAYGDAVAVYMSANNQ